MVGYMSNIVQSFVDRITESWRESVQKILQTSQILVESEKTLSDIDFLNMVDQLPMSQSTISKLLMIGKNTYLPQKVKYLPPHWTTIYEISTLDNKTIDRGVDEGFINPSSTKKEIDRFRTTIEEIGEIIEGEVVSITTDEPTFGKITVSTDFDLDKIDDLRKDLTKLEKKYGIIFSSDKSKSGLLGLRRKLLSKQIDEWLEDRKSEYNKPNLSFDDIQILEDSFGQLRGDITYHQNSDGTYSVNDIRNPKHPYYGFSSGNLYHFCRENMIVCRWTQLKEIDKVGYIKSLIKVHCDGDSQKRSDVKKKLQRLLVRGNEESKRESEIGLKMLIEG